MNILDAIDLAVNGLTFMLPMLGVAGFSLIGYFCTMGDVLCRDCPWLFPKDGYLFSDASVPWYAFIAPIYLAWTYYSMLDRFEVTDEIKGSMPAIKTKIWELAVKTGETSVDIGKRTIVVWEKYFPIVRTKSAATASQALMQGKSFARLNYELTRHCAMRLGLIAMSGGNKTANPPDQSPEKRAMLAAIQSRIHEHGNELKSLWKESRYFAMSFAVIVVLFALIIILM